jgi:predicted phosphoadenosine phosphosulfate sulfurtransferase
MYEPKKSIIIENFNHNDSYELFLYALKAPETKRQYPKRLKVVFDYFNSINELKNTKIQDQCKEVVIKTLQDPSWLSSCLIRFIMFQNDRIQRKEYIEI